MEVMKEMESSQTTYHATKYLWFRLLNEDPSWWILMVEAARQRDTESPAKHDNDSSHGGGYGAGASVIARPNQL